MTWFEVSTNIVIGGVVAGLITYAVLTLELSKEKSALYSTIACTVWSILRQYVIRRYFNKLTKKVCDCETNHL